MQDTIDNNGQNTLQEQERDNRPTRFVPRNFKSMDEREAEHERMEHELGIDFVDSRKEPEQSTMEELGVDEI